MSDRPIVVTDPETVRGERPSRSSRRSPPGSNVGITLLLIIVVAALAVAGWFIWTLHAQLSIATATLESSSSRLQELEQSLQQTQGTFSESGEDIRESLLKWESEIRKLWDVSNKRNRDWIKANESDIATVNVRVDDSNKEIQSVEQHIADVETTIQQIARQQRDITDNVNTSNQQTKALREQLQYRVQTNEEAIQAIDTSRIQNNNRLLDLERRIRDLEARP